MSTTVYTLTGMLSQIQSDTGRTSSAQVTAMRMAIERAIEFYKKRRFYFNETRVATFNTAVGFHTYTFNTLTTTGTIGYEFGEIDGCWITFATGDVREIDKANYDDFEEDTDNELANGQPTQFGYINRALRFDYAADAIYSVRLAGHLILAGPQSDGETDNPWMTEGYNLIMSRAKAELYAHRWEDYVSASGMQQAETLALKALTDTTVDRLRTGFVQATEF